MIATVPLPAYVVIYFEQERKYVMIRIEDFVNYRETSKKKSGSFKDMEKIAERIIELSTGL
jgi:penicillin-binding protein-related factor A (putative recombinase)